MIFSVCYDGGVKKRKKEKNMEGNIKGFVMYEDYSEYISFLSREEKGDLLEAILDFAFCGEKKEGLSPLTSMAFAFIKNQIERDREKYEKKCSANKKNGGLGGRPKVSKAEEVEEQPKKAEEKEEKTAPVEWEYGAPVQEGSIEAEDFDAEMKSEESYEPECAFSKYEPEAKKEEKASYRDSIEMQFQRQVSEDHFNRFWYEYPRKVGRGHAFEVFKKLYPDRALVDLMIEAIKKQKKTEAWKREEGRYIPYPENWLEGRRWEDEVGKAPSPPQKRDGQDGGGGSFDTDDFFEANLRRTYAGLGEGIEFLK